MFPYFYFVLLSFLCVSSSFIRVTLMLLCPVLSCSPIHNLFFFHSLSFLVSSSFPATFQYTLQLLSAQLCHVANLLHFEQKSGHRPLLHYKSLIKILTPVKTSFCSLLNRRIVHTSAICWGFRVLCSAAIYRRLGVPYDGAICWSFMEPRITPSECLRHLLVIIGTKAIDKFFVSIFRDLYEWDQKNSWRWKQKFLSKTLVPQNVNRSRG
jgi:hypothetical protein